MKRFAPATERNREPIREVLARVLPATGTVLELASGSGEHAVAFARAFPALTWQPSDAEPAALASIAAWRAEAGLANLRAPVVLDAASAPWPIEGGGTPIATILCCNMIHISPWEATLGLVAGAARLGAPLLVLYGPYLVDGETAPSNRDFDRSLRSRDPRWGVRELRDVETAAAAHGFALREMVAMPANNLTVVFRPATS